MKITDKERKVIIDTMAEWMKNCIYMNAKRHMENVYNQIPERTWDNPENTVHVTYDFKFVVNDMIQILGGMRRPKVKKAGKKK